MIQNLYIRWFIIFSVISVCFFMFNNNDIKYGRDLAGGALVLFQVSEDKFLLSHADDNTRDKVQEILNEFHLEQQTNQYLKNLPEYLKNINKYQEFTNYYLQFISEHNLESTDRTLLTDALFAELTMKLSEARNQNLTIIKHRLAGISASGLGDYSIKQSGESRIEASFPPASIDNIERIKGLITKEAQFAMTLSVKPELVKNHIKKINKKIAPDEISVNFDYNGALVAYIPDTIINKYDWQVLSGEANSRYLMVPSRDTLYNKFYILKKRAVVNSGEIESASVLEKDLMNAGSDYPVQFTLNAEATTAFRSITSKTENKGRHIAIIVDNTVYMAPTINEPIPDGTAQISGNNSLNDAQDLKAVMQSGSLSAPMESISEYSVSSTLGEQSIQSGKNAMIGALATVLIFMIFYYSIRNTGSRLAGVIACIALILNIFIVFSILIQMQWDLTLPGIAGLLLTVGMSVDANVIIFERIKEEVEELKIVDNFYTSIEKGYKKAFVAILDANLTTLIIAVILFGVATDTVKGFGVTLAVGILSSLFTGVFITQTLLLTYASLYSYKGRN